MSYQGVIWMKLEKNDNTTYELAWNEERKIKLFSVLTTYRDFSPSSLNTMQPVDSFYTRFLW